MEEKSDLSDFDHEMNVDARRGGLSISNSWSLGIFNAQPSLKFRDNGVINKKHPGSLFNEGRQKNGQFKPAGMQQ